MSVPYIHSEVLVMDANFRTGMGGMSNADAEKIINVRIDDITKRMLVQTSSDARQPTSLYWNEVTVIATGVTVVFSSALCWISFINDDSEDDVYIHLGSLTAVTDSAMAWKLKPVEVLDLNQERIPDNTTTLVLTTLPGKISSVRIGAGLV